MLWADKYRPNRVEEIAGQGKPVQEVLDFVESFRPGKAVLLSGPTGTGKTSLIEALAKEKGFELQRLNASDKRGSEEIESFAQVTKIRPMFQKGKIILIDEVDGIPGTDRGAVGAIAKLIKTSRFPVFLIAIDQWKPKLRPLHTHSKQVKFSKVSVPSITKKLKEIAQKEGVSVPEDILKSLARWSGGDLRSAINDLEMVCQGKKELGVKDMESLGYRERGNQIFEILPTIFKSGSINSAKKMIQEADMDADSIFWWIEGNIPMVYSGETLARAYELLSKADMFRAKVMKQQNWRFKAFMVDMLSSISVGVTERKHGYIPFRPPDRLMQMGRTKFMRARMNSLCKKIGEHTHCSSRIVKKAYLPYLKAILKKGETIDGMELEDGELDILNS